MTHDPIEDAMRLAHDVHVGPIVSDIPGRTDAHMIDVPAESFVIPADVVSGLGQGNTLAGMKAWMMALGMSEPRPKRAAGGSVPIAAAGGEIVVPPDVVARIGGGDLKAGHETLRKAVEHARADIIKQMKRLPGPHK